MRTATDAIRSTKRYVAEVLAKRSPLVEAASSDGVRWTFNRYVKGAVDVPRETFEWLLLLDRYTADVAHYSDERTWTAAHLVLTAAEVHTAWAALPAGTCAEPLSSPVLAVYGDLPQQEDWEVRLWAEAGEYQTPFARVIPVAATATSGPATYYDRAQPMVIECYPSPSTTVAEAQIKAHSVDQLLTDGFIGIGVAEGRAKRVPLYDYEGRGIDEPSNRRESTDFMRVESFSTRTLPDLEDPRRIGLVADLRVSWRVAIDMTELRDTRNQRRVRGTRTVGSVATEFTYD